jgi:hypothetical protein
MKKITSLLALLYFSLNNAIAARVPATIIMADGKTIQATIDIPDGDKKYRHLQETVEYFNADGSKQLLKADEVKEISFANEGTQVKLVSIPYKDTGLENPAPADRENILVQQVVDGKVSVYKFYYIEPGGQFAPSVVEKYLLKKEGDEFYEPAYMTFKKDMVGYLCDCPTLIDKIEEGQYKRKQLPLLIAEYNQTCGY